MLEQNSDVIAKRTESPGGVEHFKSQVRLGFDLVVDLTADKSQKFGRRVATRLFRHHLQSCREELKQFELLLGELHHVDADGVLNKSLNLLQEQRHLCHLLVLQQQTDALHSLLACQVFVRVDKRCHQKFERRLGLGAGGSERPVLLGL